MKFIKANAEWWVQTGIESHIAKVARICYKSKTKPALTYKEQKVQDMKMCEHLWVSGHKSMFRHGTVYYFVKHENKVSRNIWTMLKATPYANCTMKNNKVWVSTNMQFVREHSYFEQMMRPFIVSEEDFLLLAEKYECEAAFSLIRMTIVVTTQRIQGESYNRKSPNCIAEQSTRYVNLQKKGGVLICRPHWEQTAKWHQRMVSHIGYWVAEKVYQYLLWSGLKPEDARGNLTFNTYTVAAYTYDLSEWQHIMDMRLRDMTGKAHPDAHILAEKISEVINTRMSVYESDFRI